MGSPAVSHLVPVGCRRPPTAATPARTGARGRRRCPWCPRLGAESGEPVEGSAGADAEPRRSGFFSTGFCSSPGVCNPNGRLPGRSPVGTAQRTVVPPASGAPSGVAAVAVSVVAAAGGLSCVQQHLRSHAPFLKSSSQIARPVTSAQPCSPGTPEPGLAFPPPSHHA